jgi:exosortase A
MSHFNKKWLVSIISFLILFAFLLFLFWNTFFGMVSIWIRSETFAHGFLVLPIVIWLIWRKRDLIAVENPKITYWTLIPIFLTALVWLLGDLVAVNSVTQLAVTALIPLIVLSVFGWRVTKIIIFPLIFLFFSVPLGEFLLPFLMEWTAKFTVFAIRLSGVPVYQEGLQFVISSGSWSVVEACSGVRYLISSLMIGTLYAYLSYTSLKKRLIFIGVSIVVPILANWFRAYFIVMLGHLSGNKLAVGFDHLIYGWLFFGLVIVLMFVIGGRWAEDSLPNVKNLSADVSHQNFYAPAYFYVTFLVFLSFAIPRFWGDFIYSKNNLNNPLLAAPLNFSAGWENVADIEIILKPNFHGSAIQINNFYEKKSSKVGFYVAYYRNQNYSNKLINFGDGIFDSKNKNWFKLSQNNSVINNGEDNFSVRTGIWRSVGLGQQARDTHLQAWQFYWVNGSFVESDYKAKIYGALQRLLGMGDDSAIIVVYADDNGDLASKSLNEFLRENSSEIKKLLEKTRAN